VNIECPLAATSFAAFDAAARAGERLTVAFFGEETLKSGQFKAFIDGEHVPRPQGEEQELRLESICLAGGEARIIEERSR